MANYILFGIYLLVILCIFGFIAVFMMHIRDYQKYSSYIFILTRAYIAIMVILALFGGYHIFTGTIFPHGKSPTNKANIKKINL